MQSSLLEPADPSLHFGAIAALMSTHETEPNTASTLAEWYTKQLPDGIWMTVATTFGGEVLGFSNFYRAYTNRERYFSLTLVVAGEKRECGIGSLLYDDVLDRAKAEEARIISTRVRDTCEEGMHFAIERGFIVKKHSIEMMFDLNSWDESRYEPKLHSLAQQGFHFTNMEELGDTPEARRNLYSLNNSAASTDPGSDGVAPWATFEEFDRDVCSSSWYHPNAQIVAIDTNNGEWAAMSAITVFEGADHAYNLFTGTDVRYRGRGLAQAVKALALRRARTFGVEVVRTSHNSENEAMIAIDTKLGYVRTPGMYTMEKTLE